MVCERHWRDDNDRVLDGFRVPTLARQAIEWVR